MITKEAIEAAAKELLAHGEFGTSDGANRRNAVVAAEAALTAALAAVPGPAVKVKPLEDMEEVRKAVFGDVGDEPDVYADYDRRSELSGKMRQAIEELRHPITPAPDLAAENERLRAALERIARRTSVTFGGPHSMSAQEAFDIAAAALEGRT